MRAQENFVFRSRPCCVAARSGNLRWVGEYKSLVRGPDRRPTPHRLSLSCSRLFQAGAETLPNSQKHTGRQTCVK